MFIDIAKIKIVSGKGGDGKVGFHREKYVAAGGPDGGDGGRGGSVIFKVDDNLSTLLDFRYKKKYVAAPGEPGGGKRCKGKDGADLIIRVPRGTIIRDQKTGQVMKDMSDSEPFVAAKGGNGGWGNTHFATPTRQAPRFAKPGLPGVERDIVLELKLLADVGLVGFPNVGKSTLLSMASAGSTFVSQNCGAGQPDRVRKGMKEIYLYSVVVAVAAVLLMRVAAPWMVAFVSGSSEPIVLENGARYLLWNAPFYAVLGILLSTRYALQSLGNKVLPLFSSVIELVGKVVFVVLFIPKFGYDAVILCEPIIWCVMAAYLVAVYRHDPFVFPKQEKR